MGTYRPANSQPPPPEVRFGTEYILGTVLGFAKKFDRMRVAGDAYHYIAYHAKQGEWYLSGRETRPYTWPELVAFIGDSPCSIVSEWTTIPQTGSGDLGNSTLVLKTRHWPLVESDHEDRW